jgi:tetratricopeptide (TPR) repeat protein
MYQEAVELDPQFAAAYAALSRGHSAMYSEFHDHTDQRLLMARQTVDRALQLEPDLSDAHWSLGKYYYSCMLYDSAMTEFAIALDRQPNNSDLYAAIAGLQRGQGKIDSALVNFKKAFRIDPLSHLKAFDISYTYGLVREYPTARAYLDSAIAITPDWSLAYIYKAWLYLFMEGSKQEAARVLQEASGIVDLAQSEYREYYWWLSRILDDDYSTTLGRITVGSDTASYYLYRARIYGLMEEHGLKSVYSDSAITMLEPRVSSFPDEPRYHSMLGLAYAGLGRKEEAISEGVEGVRLSRGPLNRQFMVKNLAEIYMSTGEFDSAVQMIETLLSIPGLASPQYLQIDPLWAPLKDHPGFLRLLPQEEAPGGE